MTFYSLVMYAGDGSNRNFTIHFPYLDKSHVKVKINSVPTPAFSWLTSSSIQFNTAPAAGANIEIYRETPLNYAPVDFTDGSILLEQDLDLLTTFNLYVDQEITDRATLAISKGSGGSGGASNGQDLETIAARDAAVKAARDAEAARDAAVKAAADAKAGAGAGSQAATSGAIKASSVTVQGRPTSFVDVQTSDDFTGNKCGVRYLNMAGSPKYQSVYTPSDGIFRYSAEGMKGEWRWGINGHENGMSFKRGTWAGDSDEHYVLNVGEPSAMGDAIGGALNIHGNKNSVTQLAKVALYNSGELHGGMLASNYELNLYAAEKVTLMGLNSETFFTAWRDHALLIYGSDRTNEMQWQADGNIVLSRNENVVWNISNYITSDVRLKTDIKPLEGSSLEKVKKLTAKTYLWKDDLMGKGDKREIGLIAQEVAEVVPEVVSKMSSSADTLGVAYTQLVPLLVEAVKELSAKVESLEAQLVTKE